MEGQLIFCSDAILRFRSDYDETTAVPLLSIQNCASVNDPYFLLRFFRHCVTIEQGTTLADIFFAIEPWKELLGAYLDRDVEAYINEIKKPSNPSSWNLEWIGIDRQSYIHRAWQREDPDGNEDLTAFFNRKRLPTDEFEIETSCDASGFSRQDKERWSISENIHEIKNLPVILHPKQTLMTLQQDTLLSINTAGVCGAGTSHYIYGDTDFSFREVMEAIFISGLFYDSPRAAASSVEELNASLAGINREELKISELPPNIVQEGKPLKIEVAEGVFDSLLSHMESETESWQRIKQRCQKEGLLPVRIGAFKPAEPPELRLCGEVKK